MAEHYPPSYSEATRQHAADSGFLTFQDFKPYILEAGGIFSRPKYESFSVLIERANEWLANTTYLEVKTCESVEFKISNMKTVDFEKMTYFEYGENRTYYLRGLRLWLCRRTDTTRPPQQIRFINLIPEKKISHNKYETLNQVVDRFNQTNRHQPLPGRILTVETQEMKVSHYNNFDPDRSYWSEHGDCSKSFIFVVRVFYEVCQSALEDIGIIDFIPQIISPGGIFSNPLYEPFSSVVKKAAAWCSSQDILRFCHAQSVESKIKSSGNIDTQRMQYTEHSSRNTRYIRILRLTYAYPINTVNDVSCPSKLTLTCKTFIPHQLSGGLHIKYEKLSSLKNTISTWIGATGARVLSVETAAMRLQTGGEAYQGVEASYTYNCGQRSEYWIKVIRVYLDGAYYDPPPHILAPQPQQLRQRQESCCIT